MKKDHYTIISADTHAGGSHAAYREYLDRRFLEEFDTWRERYRNPYKDLGDHRRYRNWDNDLRNSQQLADGVVGEVIFPNTVPPFFPSFVLTAPPPSRDDYAQRLAGIRAHNRWLADFYTEFPERRAGIGQIFVNDIDTAMEDVRWIKENNLRGGVLLPSVPPDATWLLPLNHPDYDRLWALCQELQVPINSHSGPGSPRYADVPSSALIQAAEFDTFAHRQLLFLLLAGVFERFPGLIFVMTEQGASWIPPMLEHLDRLLASVRDTGSLGELRFDASQVLPRSATEYFHQSVRIGVSQPTHADAAVCDRLGVDFFMWGSDYPHDEGTYPFTREALRQVFAERDERDLRKILAGNAAEVYGFDLTKLSPLAQQFGPTVADLARPLHRLPDDPNAAVLRNVTMAAP